MPSATISSLIDNLQDPLSLEIRAQIARIADLDTPVLICGETGSGKDVWVDYLQAISRYPRLLNLHCGDVPETLLESEWFGYTKGAFTGADRDYEGKWQSADNGIIFLNQVDLLSLNLQAKLLRIIERKKYYPLGSNREVTIQARFVFSADSGIEERVARGEFRSDLYYRIAVYKIFIPPLRERPKDLRALLAFFAGREGVQLEMDPKAEEMLHRYPWPGNIRELENFVHGAAIRRCAIGADEVQGLYAHSRQLLEYVKAKELSLAEMEQEYMEYLLKKYRNKSRVAALLGINRKSLYNKLKKP